MMSIACAAASYTLTLYVAHQQQVAGVQSALAALQQRLPALRYTLTAINVINHEALCEQQHILVCPVLVITQPGEPDRRIAGSLDAATLAQFFGVTWSESSVMPRRPVVLDRPVMTRPPTVRSMRPTEPCLRDLLIARKKSRKLKRRIA